MQTKRIDILIAGGGMAGVFAALIETEPGEYSYPAIIPTATGMAITYTHNRKTIAFWHGSIEQVTTS